MSAWHHIRSSDDWTSTRSDINRVLLGFTGFFSVCVCVCACGTSKGGRSWYGGTSCAVGCVEVSWVEVGGGGEAKSRAVPWQRDGLPASGRLDRQSASRTVGGRTHAGHRSRVRRWDRSSSSCFRQRLRVCVSVSASLRVCVCVSVCAWEMATPTPAKSAPAPRLCRIAKRADFTGFGFNLHAGKVRQGQFIGKVDAGSPAQAAGLLPGDRIVEVNGVNIANENHKQVRAATDQLLVSLSTVHLFLLFFSIFFPPSVCVCVCVCVLFPLLLMLLLLLLKRGTPRTHVPLAGHRFFSTPPPKKLFVFKDLFDLNWVKTKRTEVYEVGSQVSFKQN